MIPVDTVIPFFFIGFVSAAAAVSGPRVVKPTSAPSGGVPSNRPSGPSSAPAGKKVVKSGGAMAAKKPAGGKSGSPPAALSGGIASESDTSLEECEARCEEIFSGQLNFRELFIFFILKLDRVKYKFCGSKYIEFGSGSRVMLSVLENNNFRDEQLGTGIVKKNICFEL